MFDTLKVLLKEFLEKDDFEKKQKQQMTIVSSADNFCKQFVPRSGMTKHWSDLDSNCLTIWWY